MSVSNIRNISNYEDSHFINGNYRNTIDTSKNKFSKIIKLKVKPSELGINPRKAPKTVTLTEEQTERLLFKYFGLDIEEAKKRLNADNPFEAVDTEGNSSVFTYNSKTGGYEAEFRVQNSLFEKLSRTARQIKDEKTQVQKDSPNEANAARNGIDNTANRRAELDKKLKDQNVDLRKLAEQAEVLTSDIGIPTNPNELKTFYVTPTKDPNLSNEDNALLALIKDNYGGGNLSIPDFREILSLAKDSGVKVQNLQPNGDLAKFDLSIADILRVKIARIGVQEKVNNVEKVYRDTMDNNEVSSFIRGVVKGGYRSAAGTIGLITDLSGTLKTLWQVISSPVETFNALKKELGETWEEFKNAPSNKKSEMIGELVGSAIVELLLGKGIGKAGSILAKTKTGAELIEKAKILKAATATKLAETFSDEAAKLASVRAKKTLATTLYSGIPANVLADIAIVAGNKVKNGAIKFAEFSKQMVDDFGEKVKPYLDKIYREKMIELGLADKIDEVGIKTTNITEIERRSVITPSNIKDIVVPSVRSGKFASWFNSLSKNEIDTLWTDKVLRSTIESRLRHPGGFHEWLPVSRTPKFKEWGIKAEQIWEWRSETKDLKFVNPPGRHGGAGSAKAHNEIFALVDQAKSFEEFKSLLIEWATRRLPNGVNDLPKGLRK